MTQPKSRSLEVATQSPPNSPISLLGCSKSRPHSLLPPSTSTADVRHVPFLPYVTSKTAACPSSSSSSFDSHKRRTQPVESILAWTDRSLLLLEWHPAKSESSRNCFLSVGKLSASAFKMTCALLFHQSSRRSDNSATLNFSPLITGLSRFSAFRNSLFRLKESKLLKRMLH